jgi:hypothetical protein
MGVQPRNEPLSDGMRAAILSDGRPLRQIAMRASVPASAISRFINRRRGLSARSLDRVAGVVGVELRPRRHPA